MKPCSKCGQLHPPKLPCHLANASQDATIVNSDSEAQHTIQNFNDPDAQETLQNVPDTGNTLFQPTQEEAAPTLFQPEAKPKNLQKNTPKPSPTPIKHQAKAAYQIPAKSTPKPAQAPAQQAPAQQAPAPQTPAQQRAAPSQEEIAPGVDIGGYIIEDLLGHGGMGEVWRAVQPTIKRKVAIKILDARLSSDQSLITRFLREAQTVNEIHHRNLVDIYGFGQLPSSKRPYLVMEYLEGQTLARYLQERGPMPLLEIELILEQVCEAIGAAHQHGVIHRDLKPENIFLIGQKSDRFFVKVLDFGVAKARHSEEQQLTQTGEVFGTAEYMSPEQCMGAKQVDHRSDLYSLGIVLFEMIANKTPFGEPGDKSSHIWMRHVSQEPPAVTSFVDGRALPPGIDKMIFKALAKESTKRYQSAMELFEAFRSIVHNNQSSTSKPITSSNKALGKDKESPKAEKRRDSDPPKAAFLAPGQAPPDFDIAALKAAKQKNISKVGEAPPPKPITPPEEKPRGEDSEPLLPAPRQGLPVFYLGLGIGTALIAFFLVFRFFIGGSSQAPNEPVTPLSPKQSNNLIPAVANTVATSLSTQPVIIQSNDPKDPPKIAFPKPQAPMKSPDMKAVEPAPAPNVKEVPTDVNNDTLNPFKKQ